MRLEVGEEVLEVVRFEGDVRIQISHDVEIGTLQSGIAGLEALHFGTEVAISMLGHPHELDPRMAADVAGDDLIRAVSGAVAHDDPLRRQHRLRQHC
jgi:hypothetical protein